MKSPDSDSSRMWHSLPRLAKPAALVYVLDLLVRKATGMAVITNDTASYIHKDALRPPAYPALIDVFTAVVGDGTAWLYALIVFQCLAAAACAWRLCAVLRKSYGLPEPAAAVVLALLLLPAGTWYGSLIGPEMMLYACALLALSFIAEGLAAPSLAAFSCAAASGALAMLFKPQGTFLLALAAAGAFAGRRLSSKSFRFSRFLAAAALCYCCAAGCAALYHKIVNGNRGFPLFSYMVAGNLLRLSEPADANRFAPADRKLASVILDEMEARGYTLRHGYTDINQVLHHTSLMTAGEAYGLSRGEVGKKIVAALLPKYFLKYVFHAGWKLLRSVRPVQLLVLALLLMLPGWSAPAAGNVLMSLVLLSCLLNRMTIVPLVELQGRFLFITDATVVPLFIAVAFRPLLEVLSGGPAVKSAASIVSPPKKIV